MSFEAAHLDGTGVGGDYYSIIIFPASTEVQYRRVNHLLMIMLEEIECAYGGYVYVSTDIYHRSCYCLC